MTIACQESPRKLMAECHGTPEWGHRNERPDRQSRPKSRQRGCFQLIGATNAVVKSRPNQIKPGAPGTARIPAHATPAKTKGIERSTGRLGAGRQANPPREEPPTVQAARKESEGGTRYDYALHKRQGRQFALSTGNAESNHAIAAVATATADRITAFPRSAPPLGAERP